MYYLLIGLTLLIFIKERYKRNSLIKIMNRYEIIINDQGEKTHEYKNQLVVLGSYINNKKKLKEYLNLLLGDFKTGENYEIRQLSRLSSSGLKELIYYKMNSIYKNKIKFCPYFSYDIDKCLKKINTKLYSSITKIIGVFLDNAIEEASKSYKKEVYLSITSDKDYIYITIKNRISKECNINKIGINNYTTKGFGHGYGLLLVKKLVRDNKKLETVTEFDNDYFSQTLLIDNK